MVLGNSWIMHVHEYNYIESQLLFCALKRISKVSVKCTDTNCVQFPVITYTHILWATLIEIASK